MKKWVTDATLSVFQDTLAKQERYQEAQKIKFKADEREAWELARLQDQLSQVRSMGFLLTVILFFGSGEGYKTSRTTRFYPIFHLHTSFSPDSGRQGAAN